MPCTSNLYLGLTAEEMKGYSEIYGPWQIQEIIQDDRYGDDDRLADFGTVDAGKNVDAIGGECREE